MIPSHPSDPLNTMAARRGVARDAGGAIRWLRRVLGAIVALVLCVIMGLTFCDVFMRYWFAAPIRGASEIVRFAMAILIFSAFPLVTLSQQHITVNLLQGSLRDREPDLVSLSLDPLFDKIRTDPPVAAILRELNLRE